MVDMVDFLRPYTMIENLKKNQLWLPMLVCLFTLLYLIIS
jgi:hypothetical protein